MDAEDAAVRAYVTAHLQPHFDNEKSLLAHLQLQSPGERPKKLAAQCAIQLGKAALYVQRFCSSDNGATAVGNQVLESMLQSLNDIKMHSKRVPDLVETNYRLGLTSLNGTPGWEQGYSDGKHAAAGNKLYLPMDDSRTSEPGYYAGYISGCKSVHGYALSNDLRSEALQHSDIQRVGLYSSTPAVSGPCAASKLAPIQWALSRTSPLTLGVAAPPVLAASSGDLTVVLVSGELPPGLKLECNMLTGVVASVRLYKFTLQVQRASQGLASGSISEERTFEQSGVQGIGGGFGLPGSVQVTSELPGSTAATYTAVLRELFSSPDVVSRTINATTKWGNFTVTYQQPTRVTHVRFWVTPTQMLRHGKGQWGFEHITIYGDDTPLAEYGPTRHIDGPGIADNNWTELSSALTLAIPAPGGYLRYQFRSSGRNSYSQHLLSLGRIQLLDVGDGAAVPKGMFLKAPVWDAPGSIVCSRHEHVQHQLCARAAGQVTYALSNGAKLPSNLFLDASGLICGQFREDLPGSAGANGGMLRTCVRALVSAGNAYASSTQEVVFYQKPGAGR